MDLLNMNDPHDRDQFIGLCLALSLVQIADSLTTYLAEATEPVIDSRHKLNEID